LKRIGNFLVASRANIQVASLPTASLGVLLAAKNQAEIIDLAVILYIIIFFTILTYSCQINCLNDLEVDAKYKKYLSNAVRSLGIPTLKTIMTIELLIGGIIIFLLCFLKKNIIYSLAFLGVISGYVYSAPPLRVKKRGILSPLPVMFGLYFLPIIAGWFIVNEKLSVFIFLFGMGYALIMQGITFINTCEDFEEDKISGIRSFAHVAGVGKTLLLGSIFVFVGGFVELSLISTKIKIDALGFVPSIAVLILGAFFVVSIIYIARNLYLIGKSDKALVLCKRYAVKMPLWFLITRYPLFFIGLLLVLFQ
jgi:4-hydroxybenzoate polyprenyltransferase